MRLLVLHQRGGVYVDADVVFLRPLHLDTRGDGSCRNVVGVETGGGGRPADHLTVQMTRGGGSGGGVHGPLIGDMIGLPLPPAAILCNAVMAFTLANSPLLAHAIDAFLDSYVPLTPGLSMPELYARGEWGAMGPLLLTRVLHTASNTAASNATCVLEEAAFYPISPPHMARHFGPWDEWRDGQLWELLQSRTIAVHYWNALTKSLPLVCDSLIHRLLASNCVVCNLPCS